MCKKDTQFKKGFNPWNKGIYCRLSPKSEFKKGHGAAPEFTTRINHGAPQVKLNGRWVSRTRYEYEKEKGDIPSNYVVRFFDGDINNFNSKNLIAVSRAENAYLNRWKVNEQPLEIRETLYLMAKLMVGKRDDR